MTLVSKRRTVVVKQVAWPFIDGKQLDDALNLTRRARPQLLKKLPEGIYWYRPEGQRRYSWNLRLVQHYVLVGPGEEHTRLVEAFCRDVGMAA